MLLRISLLAGAILLIGAGALALRGAATTEAENVSDSGIAVECSGWTGVSTGCAEWGAAVLADGPPSSTFEMEDIDRLVLDRPAFGFASGCEARYFLSRYPGDPVWTEAIACGPP